MNEILYRQYHAEDYPALIAMWDAAGLDYKPAGRDAEEAMALELTHEYSHWILAECQNRLIASVLATHDGRRGWINRLAVHPDFRGIGLGKILIAKAESWLIQQGLGILVCLIERENVASQSLFKAMNYNEQSDALYFSKRLQPGI